MLTCSQDATEAIQQLLADSDAPDGAGVRIETNMLAPSNDGAGTAPDALQIVVAPEPPRGDAVIQEAGARVFIQPDLVPFLADKMLDLAVHMGETEFLIAEQP